MNEAINESLANMTTPEAQYLKEAIGKVQAEIETFKAEEKSANYIGKYKAEKLIEIEQKYLEISEQQRELQEVKIKNFKDIYLKETNKNPNARLLALREQELSYSSMTDKELYNEVMEIKATTSAVYDVGKLETLQRELRQRSMKAELENVHNHIQKHSLNKPWLHNPTAQEASKKLHFYSNMKRGQFKGLYPNSKGGVSSADYKISELI